MSNTNNRTSSNIVNSYFFYMWNRWNQHECYEAFPFLKEHMWAKWCRCTNICTSGAAEMFWRDLDEGNRALIIERACRKFNGRVEIEK